VNSRILPKCIVGLQIIFALVSLGASQTGDLSRVDDEEYLVASSALQYLWTGDYKHEFGSPLVVLGHTTLGLPGQGLRETLETQSRPLDTSRWTKAPKASDPILVRDREAKAFKSEVSEDTISNWVAKNKDSYPLCNKFRLGVRVIVPADEDWDALSQAREEKGLGIFYQAFRAKYQGSEAIIRISRVGINAKQDQAVVEVEYITGPEGGEGIYLLLEKRIGVWHVRHVATAWMS
jgi:hypothetical protein